MAKTYQIGQFRKTATNSYMTNVSFSLNNINTTGTYSSAVTFVDKVVKISSGNLERDISYYLNFTVARLKDSDQVISVYLKNSSDENFSNIQNLYTYTIEAGPASSIVPIELIITPDNAYDEIVFELQRIAEDYMLDNKDGTYGRKLNITIPYLTRLTNILKYLGLIRLAKIGVQGPPGLLMSINGEEIRIGRSGIYEMIYDMTIESVGFVVKDSNSSNNNYFVMDYQY